MLPGGTTTGMIIGSPLSDSIQNLTSSFDVADRIFIPNPGSGGVVGRTKIGLKTPARYRKIDFLRLQLFRPGAANARRRERPSLYAGLRKTFLDGARRLK